MRSLFCSSLLLLAVAALPAVGQAPTPTTTRVRVPGAGEPPYRREFVYGVTTTSNSGIIAGGGIRSSYYWKPDWLKFWSLQINEIKNRKELRQQSLINGDQFIRGKTSYLYAVRPSVGVERIVLHKAAEQGVQVSAMLSGGPTFGLEVPYYIFYVYDDPVPLLPQDVRRERNNPTRQPYELRRVAGAASFTTGLVESKVIPGGHLRGSLAFEYGRYRESVTGLEVGAMVEAYSRKPILVPQTSNPQVFSSVFVTLFFGRRS